MDSFPQYMSVTNKLNFIEITFKNNLSLLRKEIHDHIMASNENTFYDLDNFNRSYIKNMSITERMVNIIILELTDLGWKTFLGFGGTGLYVFSHEKPLNAY
jgi:hypothetical protein